MSTSKRPFPPRTYMPDAIAVDEPWDLGRPVLAGLIAQMLRFGALKLVVTPDEAMFHVPRQPDGKRWDRHPFVGDTLLAEQVSPAEQFVALLANGNRTYPVPPLKVAHPIPRRDGFPPVGDVLHLAVTVQWSQHRVLIEFVRNPED